ncbi:hypothetical protein SODALDRAFT_329263 [Sodiomyces alkalinus F11]|uniref:Uncharacterized protein n=1 Tax=Sodiomyces alkalinus (strain CBS 110278 / VKM F-3762 / F11) TaxID=1314773 RepID=A0A3N2PKN1_SODAK|nr:hypothetical protein SODALDRAFT_329263 [Sodiomyces alkalinus F11]ROT35075.1 hypothetical protein SODALDRAFT_329263 [Sodiomyces alkalinus F11]
MALGLGREASGQEDDSHNDPPKRHPARRGFTTETIEIVSPFPPHPPRIEPYNPLWPIHYAQFAKATKRALGARGVAIHSLDHVGSTSVPGLHAKPIIDMDETVRCCEDGGGEGVCH